MIPHLLRIDTPFSFEAGGTLPSIELAYHTSPGRYEPGRKVIWICHALTANSDPEDWWADLVGPGRLLDTEKYYIVCVNMLGSCYGSSGPSSLNPLAGKPYFFDFPQVTVRDIVRGLDLVREHLGIGSIDLLIGSSIGGFQALEWSIMCPERIRSALYMATDCRVSPWLTAFVESQRMALEADSGFRACESLQGARKGLECARSIAMLSYRCEEGYDLKQEEPDIDTLFADRAASYQRYQGKKLADRFDAWSYWYVSGSVISQNVGRGRGSVEAALSRIKARSVVTSIDTDLIFPPSSMEKMASMIEGTRYMQISSKFGHDGFLLEKESITEILENNFLCKF